ncbi:MAG: D-glycero-beta-D-manno-heptose-7-phosphate kinase [Ignavibacteriaceae bacterium]|nr:D-glycero-beta-D-manno-heptose-7-phosphate kinase [Ignavibacteriaceae bacterium]NUM69961.1 D-glycero-beta-D-manno-heptose-7-phosphate kinase [Ignavibacteriaceae bacterium]
MIKIEHKRLKELKKGFKDKRIAIIGDMMLDCYIMGETKRISPEAPVPVVEVYDEFYRFGGAANCANNILHLTGDPFPIGVIGNDGEGIRFIDILQELKISNRGIIHEPNRPTTIKTRVIAANQHVVRIDKETKADISAENVRKILSILEEHKKSIDAIILQDYNKGVMTAPLIESVIEFARKNNILITVDPKFNNFFSYKGVTVFKPNRKEAEDVLGIKIKTDDDVKFAGEKLLHELKSDYVLLTLGEGGIAVFEKGKEHKRMPTKARKVADVSGAGDTVISTLTIALAAGANIYEACYLANYAAGIVCEEVGIIPIEIDKLFDTVGNH